MLPPCPPPQGGPGWSGRGFFFFSRLRTAPYGPPLDRHRTGSKMKSVKRIFCQTLWEGGQWSKDARITNFFCQNNAFLCHFPCGCYLECAGTWTCSPPGHPRQWECPVPPKMAARQPQGREAGPDRRNVLLHEKFKALGGLHLSEFYQVPADWRPRIVPRLQGDFGPRFGHWGTRGPSEHR